METRIDRQTYHMGIWLWLVGGAALVAILSRHILGKKKIKGEFLNERGERIKEITRDVRLWKFVRSLELSQMGQETAAGEPYLIQSGPYRELVISQPSHIREFYELDAKQHQKPKNFNFGEPFGRLAGDAVGAKYGDDWRKLRKQFDPIFSFHSIVKSKTKFDREIQQWIQGLAPSGVGEINPNTAFKYFTFRALALHLYGDAFDDRMYWRMLELNEMHEGVLRSLLVSKWPDSKLYNLLPTAQNRKMSSYLSQWKEFNRTIIEHVRGGGWECPVEVIYSAVDPRKEITEDEVRTTIYSKASNFFLATMDEILFTNVDVSSKVFATIFTNLANDISVQNALRAEIKSKRTELGDAKYLANTDTLLNRIVMESMRLSPAFWFSMPESTAQNKTIGGYLIPANTPVVIDTRRLNNDPYTFGCDSEQFRPDRFESMQSEKLRCGFMRFGTGAATGRCLGKNAADVLFKIVIIAVVEKFKLSRAETGEKKRQGDAENVILTKIELNER